MKKKPFSRCCSCCTKKQLPQYQEKESRWLPIRSASTAMESMLSHLQKPSAKHWMLKKPANPTLNFKLPAVLSPKKSAILGAAFLMATSAIGPGFLTQTAKFTAELGTSFGFVILVSLLLDIGAQLNIWRIIAVAEMRAQDIANRML